MSRFCTLFAICLSMLVRVDAPAQTSGSVLSAGEGRSSTYQITTTHTGAIETKHLIPPLAVRWSVDLGGATSYPIVAGGRVFVIAGPVSPGAPSFLYGLDAQTGATSWSQPSPYGTWVGAAYENGMVYVVPASGAGLNGAMVAYSASTGNQIWSTTLANQSVFSSPPTAFNGMVYTGGSGSGGTLYAVEETAGGVVWTASVKNGDTSSPAVNPTGVYVSYICPQTYRFNPTTGAQIWNFSGSCEGSGGNTPVVYKGLVYVRDAVSFNTNGLILNTTDGTVVGGFNSHFAPVFRNGVAFYTESTELSAVDLSTGNVVWTATPSSGDSFSTSPIIVNSVVYVGTGLGNLMGYQAGTGINVVSMNLGATISGDEGLVPQAGLGAGQGLLVVPVGTQIIALQ